MAVVGAGEAIRLAKALVVGPLRAPTPPLVVLGGVLGRGLAGGGTTGRRRGDGAGILDLLLPTAVARGTKGFFPALDAREEDMPPVMLVVLDLALW